MTRSLATGAGDPVLSFRGVGVTFSARTRPVVALDDVSMDVAAGEVVAILGESGSGKTTLGRVALGLMTPGPDLRLAGTATVLGVDVTTASPGQLRDMRGRVVSLIPQNSLNALNPLHRVGRQLEEAIRLHDRDIARSAARERATQLLGLVGIGDARTRLESYPHELSGGMRQRVTIAMAIANDPALIVADEPTTALDVTIQAQILALLRDIQRATGTSIVLITHDLGVVAELATSCVVLYGGRVVERGRVARVLTSPRHPYTDALMRSRPEASTPGRRLMSIGGQPFDPGDRPPGCAFHPRCPIGQGRERCRTEVPVELTVDPGHTSACHFPSEVGTA